MFDLPGMEGVEEAVVNKDVVENKAKPLIIYSERGEEAESSSA